MSTRSRELLRSFERDPDLREKLSQATPLYIHLIKVASHRGVILRRIDRLAVESGIASGTIPEQLERLSQAGLVTVLNPPPYLVLRLHSWSGKSSPKRPIPLQNGDFQGAAIAARGYSYTHTREDGGLGEGEARRSGLLGEILTTLGESDPAPFEPLLGHYSPETIRRALRRVERTPAESIRTTKTALFRFLLGRLT